MPQCPAAIGSTATGRAAMKRVFITGASSGIGAALARHYAAQGALLGLVGRRQDALQEVLAQLPAAPSTTAAHRLYVLDVTDSGALQNCAEDFLAHAGGIDIVIAAAGVSHGTLTEMAADLSVFSRILATNVTATVATFAPFIAAMKSQPAPEQCRLVGIGSVAGIRGLPGAGAYSGSKAAVMTYCESLRIELRASGIKVVTLAPGYIDTPMTQKNHYRMPFLMPVEDFARLAGAAIARGSSYRVIPAPMALVAKLLRLLPNWAYDRLFARAPHKARSSEALQ